MTDRDLKPSQSGVFDAVIVGAGFAGMYMFASPTRNGPFRACLRGRERCWWHLVLEPLPRCALRRGEHAVFLPVLGGAPAGVGLVRAICAAAGNLALRQPCGRPV